jgi:N-acetyl-gamma-glutamylphosphate reductase
MNLKSNLQIVVFILAVLVSCSEPKNEAADTKEGSKSFKALPVSTEFDVVILNGRVMDPGNQFRCHQKCGYQRWYNCPDHRRKIFQVRKP